MRLGSVTLDGADDPDALAFDCRAGVLPAWGGSNGVGSQHDDAAADRDAGCVSALTILAYGARSAGAALAALIGEAYGPEACLLLAAFGFLVQVLVIFGLPVPRLERIAG